MYTNLFVLMTKMDNGANKLEFVEEPSLGIPPMVLDSYPLHCLY